MLLCADFSTKSSINTSFLGPAATKLNLPTENQSCFARLHTQKKCEWTQKVFNDLYVVSAKLRGSVSSLLQTVARDEDMSWARREQQALGRIPSRGGLKTNLLQPLRVTNS